MVVHSAFLRCSRRYIIPIFSRLRLPKSALFYSFAASLIAVNAHSVEPFLQDAGLDGLVTLEAEYYDDHVPRGDHQWKSYTAVGPSGGAALQASPNIGKQFHNGFVAGSPRLDYRIAFNRAGRHYLWLRATAASKKDDTVHAGLDGLAVPSASGIKSAVGQWLWANTAYRGVRVEIDVPSAEVHTLNLWMREDGIIIDKIVLTSSADYTPSGVGPLLSPRGSTPVVDNEAPEESLDESAEEGAEESPEVADSGTAALSWAIPTSREDGSMLEGDDIRRYEIRYGSTPDMAENLWVENASDTSVVLYDLPTGRTLYAAMLVRDTDGVASELSNVVQFSAD